MKITELKTMLDTLKNEITGLADLKNDPELQISIGFLEMFIVILEFKTILETCRNTPELFKNGDDAIDNLYQQFVALLASYPSFSQHEKNITLLQDAEF